jgi:hypothetical protein
MYCGLPRHKSKTTKGNKWPPHPLAADSNHCHICFALNRIINISKQFSVHLYFDSLRIENSKTEKSECTVDCLDINQKPRSETSGLLILTQPTAIIATYVLL